MLSFVSCTTSFCTNLYSVLYYTVLYYTYVSKCAAMVAENPHTAAISFFPFTLSISNSMGRGGP